ncbi:Fe(II)-2OG oxygenase family protein [Mucilaginibacter koreensis]
MEEQGFAETEMTDIEYINFAQRLGTIIPSRIDGPLIDTLIPKDTILANKPSLSMRYGLGAFPYHTDGAYLRVPPKYIMFRYEAGIDSPTPTIINPILKYTCESELKPLEREFWFVRGRNLDFYSPIITANKEHTRLFMRYDINCMISRKETSVLEDIINSTRFKQKEVAIDWFPKKVLIINNWETLHKRPSVKIEEQSKRCLKRILINERKY